MPLFRVQGYPSRNTGPRHSYPVTAPTVPPFFPSIPVHSHALPTPHQPTSRVCFSIDYPSLTPHPRRLSNEVYEIMMLCRLAPARYCSMKKTFVDRPKKIYISYKRTILDFGKNRWIIESFVLDRATRLNVYDQRCSEFFPDILPRR